MMHWQLNDLTRYWVILMLMTHTYQYQRCIHDLIAAPHKISTLHQQGYESKGNTRNKRADIGNSKPRFQFQPIRVHIQYSQMSELDNMMQAGLKNIAGKAVTRIENTLSVVPVHGPLLLKRVEACPVVFSSGINKGKCARLKKGYRGELCLGIFKIPDDHLEGLSLYNAADLKPMEEVFPDGIGINNTDIVLYVSAKTTQLCLEYKESVTAYASHCQVEDSGRPVAGLLNFCPFAVKKFWRREHLIFQITLHEVLHVLGFSSTLFHHYKHCSGTACQTYANPVRPVEGVMRLVTPTVVNYTQQHFACFTEPEFGAPLEAHPNTPVTSHWDSRRMHTSLMTALHDQSHTFLDPITLSVFQDTGWYQVDFQQADRMEWGAGAGCTFGSDDECLKDPEHFCSDNSSGCHFLLQNKAVCDSRETGKKCGIYAAVQQGSCVEEMLDKATDLERPDNSIGLEIFSSSSRCVLSSISKKVQVGVKRGQCYQRRCFSDGSLQIKMNGSDWITCNWGKFVQVPGLLGEILCPRNPDTFCNTITTVGLLPTTSMVTHKAKSISATIRRINDVGIPNRAAPLHSSNNNFEITLTILYVLGVANFLP